MAGFTHFDETGAAAMVMGGGGGSGCGATVDATAAGSPTAGYRAISPYNQIHEPTVSETCLDD